MTLSSVISCLLFFLHFVVLSTTSDQGDCNFDRDLCNWTNEKMTDDFDWLRYRYSSPSLFTGPSKDHTSGRGYYIYNEASTPGRKAGQKARLLSPKMKSPKCMTFFTNLYGQYMSCVVVYISVNGTKSLLWVKSGNRGDRWIKEQVFFNEIREYQVIIEVIQSRSWSGDAAVDDISFCNGTCDDGNRHFYVSTYQRSRYDGYKIDREPQVDSFQHQFSFTARQVSGNIHESKYYIYTEGVKYFSGRPSLSPYSFPLDFFYDSQGSINGTKPMSVVTRSNGIPQQVSLVDTSHERCCPIKRVRTIYVKPHKAENPSCLPGWLSAGSGCYRFYVNEKRTWDGARIACRNLGGDLAVISSIESLASISTILTKITTSLSPFHVGLRDTVTNVTQPIAWMNGEIVANKMWKSGHPRTSVADQCGGVTEVEHKLILQPCSLLTGFICESNAVDVAVDRPTNSSADSLTSSSLAVHNIPSTCFLSKQVRSPWWMVELGRELYVYTIKIHNIRSCCNISSSQMEALVVQNKDVMRAQRCGVITTYGEQLLYLFDCSPPIRGRHVMIRLNGEDKTLVLCRVSVAAFASVEEARGARRDIWYKLINTQGLDTLGENTVFTTRPQGRTVSGVLGVPLEVAEDYGELVTAYFQPPASGSYTFRLSCDDECEIWISTYQEAGLIIKQEAIGGGVGIMLVQIQRWASYNDTIGCITEEADHAVYLTHCQLYVLRVYMKEGSTFTCLRVGMEKQGQTIEEPIRKQHLFAVKPGLRNLVFDLDVPSDSLTADLGSKIYINAKYKFCCSGLYCPGSPLTLELRALTQVHLVTSSLNQSCQECTFSTSFEAVVQPGLHSIELLYSFLNETRNMSGIREVGKITVRVAVLAELDFSGGMNGWSETGWMIGNVQHYTDKNDNYAYLDERRSKAQLQTPVLPWKPFYDHVGMCLRFRYLMPNFTSSSMLKVYLHGPGNASTLLWKLNGYHGEKWLGANVPWKAQKTTKVVFNGQSTVNGSVSVAVDDIKITTENCQLTPLYASPGFTCREAEFTCDNGQCISSSQRCDSDENCLDKSDELGCKCLTSEITCPSGKCVPAIKICDGHSDCEDGLDELRCGGRCGADQFSCPEGICIPWTSTCNAMAPQTARCQDGTHRPSVCGVNTCPLHNLNCNDTNEQDSPKCRYSFKGRCSFENGFCGLKHDNSTVLRWEITAGGTPSKDTGPSYDHSTLSSRGSLIFIETSQQPQGASARLHSDWMNPGNDVCLQFWYHMYGAHIGSLNIMTSTTEREVIAWTMSGMEGDIWRFGQVTMSFKQNFMFIIEGIRGTGNKGDIAVDDITLLEGGCDKVMIGRSPDCSFESWCNWKRSGYWKLSLQSSGIPSLTSQDRGGYVYLPSTASHSRSRLTSPVFVAGTWRCMRFWYTIGLGNSAELRFLAYREGAQVPVVFGSTVRRTDAWRYVQLSLDTFSHIVQIAFEAYSTGPVVGIDDVTFTGESCDTIPWSPYIGSLAPPRPKCSDTLGMQNYLIPDSSVTASTSLRDRSAPPMGRLHLAAPVYPSDPARYYTGGWCLKRVRGKQYYLQVDLGEDNHVTRVATQGKQELDFWVKQYYVAYSPHNGTWRWVTEAGKRKDFSGNADRHTVVSHHIIPPITARYLRIYPRHWERYGCLRVDYFGCFPAKISNMTEKCQSALGIQNGRVPDASITASSAQGAAHRARLYTVGEGGKNGAWVAGVADANQWLQIDFGGVVMVTRIATQGRHDYSSSVRHWVTSYILSYSQLGRAYEWYKENGTLVVFRGNREKNAVVYNVVSPPLIGRYVRIHPKAWHDHPALRLEMFGCLAVNIDVTQIQNLGCYKDHTSEPAIPSFENMDSVLEGNYRQRAGAILRCAEAAHRRGFNVFALQNGGKCMSGYRTEMTYNKSGPATSCADNGRGGLRANEVYEIKRVCDLGDSLCSWKAMAWRMIRTAVLIKTLQEPGANDNDNHLQLHNTTMHVHYPIRLPTDAITICYWVECLHSIYSMVFYQERSRSTPNIVVRQKGCDLWIEVLESPASAEVCTCDGSWRHVCVTWKSRAGIWEIYMSGKLRAFGRWLGARKSLTGESLLSIHHVPSNQSVSSMNLTDLNIWGHMIVPEEILRMSYGCGGVNGDVISWSSLSQSLSGNKKLRKGRTCLIARGGMTFSAYNASHKNSIESPWLNRSGSLHGRCMRFRYIAHGLGQASLVIYQTLEGDTMGERPIWSHMTGRYRGWRYGQVSVGAVGKHKISIRGEPRGDWISLFSVGGVHFTEGLCDMEPELASQACNINMTSSSGYITSPYYPGYYPNNTQCAWKISAKQGHVMRITIKVFQLAERERCAGDYLEVHDGIHGISQKTTLIGRYCGLNYPPVIETATNEALIVFSSTSGVPRKGFQLYYKSKENRDAGACSNNQGGCPAGCQCYMSSDETRRLVVEGGSLVAVPSDIPLHTSVMLLGGSRITQVKTGDFVSLRILEYIDFSRNIILQIQDGSFTKVPSLKNLKFTSNFIQALESTTLTGLESLETLDIAENLLVKVNEQAFSTLRSLRILSLRQNRIEVLHPALFRNNTNLTYLYLQENEIEEIPDGLFVSLSNLKTLYLTNNKIKTITFRTFEGLKSLESLSLQNNKLTSIADDTFTKMAKLRFLALDHFTLCCYAVVTLPGVHCKAPTDEFSSCDDLMKNKTLQVCIWVLGVLAFAGNLFVIMWRLIIKEDNKVHSLFLTNLAVSDFLMGLYLLIIAIKDIQWRGEYFKHDITWRNGVLCQFAGALSMISSEVSVLVLTMITLDRLVCIVFPMKFKRLSHKSAIVICVVIWLFGCMIAVIPLMGLSYFYDKQRDIGFYGRSAVCLPLQLSSDRPAGWEYSVSLFIGLNFIAFLFILAAYIAMFWTVKKSSAAAGSKNKKKESNLARKLMVIILTDFCCWMPVIIIGILSLSGNFHDPQKQAYVWIAVFVLPVNSSINPILYTFSTANVKQRITDYSQSVSGHKVNTVSTAGNKDHSHLCSLSPRPRQSSKKSVMSVLIPKKVSSVETTYKINIIRTIEFLKTPSQGIVYVTCLVGSSTRDSLLKVFSPDDLKDFNNEVEVLQKLNSSRDHENLLNYRWHTKGVCLELVSSITLPWVVESKVDARCGVVCFGGLTSSTMPLTAFLQETQHSASMETLLVIAVDILHGLEYLHKHHVTHGNVTADSVLIRKYQRIPPIKAFVAAFDSAHVQYSEKRSWEAYRQDVVMVGTLLKYMLHSCGYSGEFSGKVRGVLEMCFIECANWKHRISELRHELERAWSSSNEWSTTV